jgi:Fe-S cluster assembly iron-binding protein IscA
MFEVTEKAVEMIKKAFADQEKIPSIRVVLNEGG